MSRTLRPMLSPKKVCRLGLIRCVLFFMRCALSFICCALSFTTNMHLNLGQANPVRWCSVFGGTQQGHFVSARCSVTVRTPASTQQGLRGAVGRERRIHGLSDLTARVGGYGGSSRPVQQRGVVEGARHVGCQCWQFCSREGRMSCRLMLDTVAEAFVRAIVRSKS